MTTHTLAPMFELLAESGPRASRRRSEHVFDPKRADKRAERAATPTRALPAAGQTPFPAHQDPKRAGAGNGSARRLYKSRALPARFHFTRKDTHPMARNRASARAAGTRMERLIADCLAEHVDDRIDRKVKTGATDKGDIGGVRTHTGKRVVVEVKDHSGRYEVSPWLGEAEQERINDNAEVGLVIAKRRGISDPLQQAVFMTVADLIALLTGERP